jgi:excisionase family DNA binding protein
MISRAPTGQEEGSLEQKIATECEWLDYPTAERFSSLSHTTLWRYVRSGELKSARVGRSVRIHLPTLRAFMEERSSGGLKYAEMDRSGGQGEWEENS